MPEKKYLIEIPGKTGISRFNEADWASNKDAILAKYPNANVVSIDMYDATDVQDNDEYFVEIKGRDSLSRFNGADWNKHKDAILAKYPDAKVSRMRGVDYYYDQANELGEQLNAKDTEIQTWKDQQAERTGNADWSTLLMAQSGLNPIGTGLNPEKDEEIASYIAEGQKLQEERDKIKEAYDNNPRVKAAREEWEKQYAEELERYKKEYLGNLRSEIDANMESDVDIEAALKAKSAERGVWAGAGDINPYAHSTLMDGSYAEKAKLDRYQSAKYFLDKAEEAREGQLKGFWKGVGNVAENFLEEMSNRSDIATFADIFGIMKKLEKEYGTLRNVTDKEIDKSLDSSEKALLKSYFEYADALSQNSGDAAYRGGQIAGEGVKIAIEFALTGGLAGAGSAAATKGIVAGLERWAANALKGTFKAVAKNALAKVGTLATQGLAKVALATALRPSTYEHMAEATLTVDKIGHLNPVKNASLSFVDDAIETISEMSGDVIGKVLGVPFKPIKGAMGKAFNAAFGGTKFGEWAKMFVNGPVADYLKQAGFHNLPIEILEEYVGNTMRLPINPESLSEMHQDGNFLSMLLGFTPMTLLSGGVNAASFGFASKNAKNSAAALNKLLTDKEFDEGRRKHLTDYKRDSSPMELGLEMFSLKEELKKKGATEEELQILADYASAVAEYQTLRGGMKEMESRERKQIFNEQKNQYGEFYQNEGDGRKVVIAQTKDGRQVFLTSERTPQGEFLAKDKMTGKEIVVKESELNPSMTVSLSMDNYLDGIIQSRREMAEFERMNNERNEQIAKVSSLLPSKLNLGTKAEPIMVVVKEKSEKGVTVVDESGKESVLPWSEVAMKMGMPITVMTDAQLAEAEAARIGLGRAEKKAGRATTSAEDKSIERKVGEINNEVKEATPKPEEKYTNKETGLVDEIAFWENDPVGYCDWNDRQNNDNGEDSLDIVKSNIDTVTAEIAKIDKVKTDNPVAIKATKNERRKLQQRLDTLNALKQQYEEARTPIEQKKAEQTLLFRQRVSEWRKRFGLTEDQLVIYESLNEVESPGARRQILRGKTEGWANINGEKGTRAFVYLPHITSMEELDATVMHEVAIHYGLHTLLGEQEYNKLMDQVWSMMSDAAKNTYIKYPGVYNIEDANARRRAAAEEFIAHVAENVSIDNATAEQKSFWQRIVDFFRNLFSDVNVNEKAIADIVKARVNAMAAKGMEQQATAEATEVQQTEESNKKASEEIKENITAQASATTDANAYLEAKAEEGTLMWSTSIESRRILDEYTSNQELVDMVKAAIENGVIQSSVLADNINEYEKEIAEGAERGDRWVDTESIINRIINNLETLAEGVILQNAIPAINDAQAKVNSIAKQMKDKYGMESMDQWEPEDKKTYLDAVDALVNTSNDRFMFSTEAHGGVKLSSSAKSVARFDTVNGTDVKGFFEFLRNDKKPLPGGPNVFHIANAGELLNKYGIKGNFIAGQFTFSATHTKDSDHQLGIKEWVDVINNLNSPLAITSYLGRENEYRIYTYAVIDGNSICLGVSVSKKDDSIELSNIITAFGRDVENLFKGEKIYLLYPETIDELKQNIDELKQKISQVSTTPNPWLNATSSALTEGKGINNSETSNKKDGKDLFSTSINEAESPKIDASSNEQAEGNYFFKTSNNALVGLHNITEDKLRKAFKQGGLANPSTAVVNIAEYLLDGYGEISLIMPSSLVDASTGDNVGTYTGDAWTPTYPPISRKINEKGWKAIKDIVRSVVSEDSPLYYDIINGLENYLEDNRSSKMEFVFLKEKGIEPEIAYKGADGFVGMRNLEAVLGVQGLREGVESYERYKNASPMAKRSFNMWLYANGNKQAYKELKEQIKKEPRFADVLKLNEDVSFAAFDSFTYDIFRKEQDAGKIDTYDTMGAAARYVDANNLRGEFEAWLESLMEQAEAKEVFFAGYTRDGERIYKDNTLENVSRHMRLQGRTNAYDDHGLSATKSALLQRLTSLSQIRKNKARLQNESAYNKEYDALKDRLWSVISQLADMQEISSNQFMNVDYAESRLQEAFTKRNPIAHLNNEYGYNIDPAGEYADELKSFIKDVQQMPAKYFETKFERPVYLNEFAAAVIPTTTREDIKQAISEAGLPIFEYDSEIEGSRKEATLKATEEEGIRFRTLGEKGAANLDKAEEATIRLDNLAVARQMEEAGKDAKAIKLATGWERGADNLWRYEMSDDFDLTELENTLQENLDDGLSKTWGIIYPSDLGDLTKAYPDFNVDIMVWVGDEFANTGEYSPATEGDETTFGKSASIEVKAKTVADIKDVLVHEIQHAIQEKEGFAEGGSVFGLKDKLSSELDKRVARIKGLRAEGRDAEADELMRMSKGLAEAVINNEEDIYQNYRKLAGEVEARNVSARLGMSEQERRESLLSETEDVAREDQIVLMDGLGVSEMGSRVDKRMVDIENELSGTTMSEAQKTVYNVFIGKQDKQPIVVQRKDGVPTIIMEQGADNKSGAKHAIFKHYGTGSGSFTAKDVLLIPEIVNNGTRKQDGNKVVYELTKDGVRYRVVTYVKTGNEVFNNFYTNRKNQSSQQVNAQKSDTQSALASEELASADKDTNNSGNGNTLFRTSITPEQDKAYMDAVEAGDMETAQRMVLEAAKIAMPNTAMIDRNGYPKIFYHNTGAEFTAFDAEYNGTATDAGWLGDGFYFYGDPTEGDLYGRNKMQVFLNIEEPYYATSEENKFLAEANSRKESIAFSERLKEEWYDGVYYNGDLRQEAVAFYPSQIKSADPVTYDNNGNIIPLSERFNPENEDIRFRVLDTTNAELKEKPIKLNGMYRFKLKNAFKGVKDNGGSYPYIKVQLEEVPEDHSGDKITYNGILEGFAVVRIPKGLITEGEKDNVFFIEPKDIEKELWDVLRATENYYEFKHGGAPYQRDWLNTEGVRFRIANENLAIFNGEKNGTDGDILFKTRTKPAPTKTQEVYKLMRLGVDGKLYPLFIGSADAIDLGVWYDADSPNLGDLTKLASGVHLVNNETGEAINLDQFKAEHPEIAIKGEKPNVAAINWATENGMRWILIEDKATAQKRYEGESRSYYNFGINGSGQVGLFAMRPGWHAGSLPTMRQIGKGKDKNLRDDSFVWVRGRVPADVDYQAEADANPDKDIPTHIPTDGFYMKATNANKKASQADKMGWYVAGSFIADEIISDAEARRVIDEWNAEHPDAKVEYDYARESGKEFDPARGGLVESENIRFKTEINPSEMDVDELVANGRMKLSSENQDAANILFEKISAINGNVQQLVRAAAAQKDYDKKTVKAIIDQATTLLDAGRLSDLTRGEIKRLLGAINSATGKADLTAAFDRLINIMISNQLRAGKENIDKMLRIRGKKVNAQGVEARGRMDIEGQQIMDAIRENIALSLAEIDERIAMLQDKLSSPSDSIRREAENEYVGLEFARQYVESIGNSEAEERALRKEKVEAEADYRQGVITRKEFNEFAKTIEDAIRDNRIQRVLSYQRLAADMAKMVTKSIEQAGQLREAEKQRVQKIQHFANSDMQGMPADAHTESENKFWNNPLVSLFTSPLATFEQWLRVFGAKSAEGKGYLYNHFMTAWNNANNQEYLGMKEANERLNAKAQEVFGDVVKRWSDIFSIDKKLPTLTIEWYDDGEMKQYEVSQGNLLYIYMVNKMIDGKMKLRRMGISEADVQEIEKHLDPRYIEIADWIQNEFLPSIRDKYNAVHERLFGAPMASIDNYFPIKVLANARVREVEVGTPESNSKPSTITGSIIKRTKNSLALDILHSNAFDVVLEHIEQMEHWAAFAEFNQDLNTLLSYKKFRNRVQNMSGALGSGKEAWKSFKETAEIAAGVYQPKTTKADKALNTMAKGLTAGKINFRLWTAIKQILSMPAFLPYVNPTIMAKTMATPWEAWDWAMNELPAFEKRWGGRKAGNIRLEKNEADIDSWLNNAMEVISRVGMTPNAFVDAVTCSIGARAVYQTQMERYLKEGYSEEKASEKAKLDATVAFNATQQSSEGAFVSTIQSDRTIIAYVLTVFRNNSFGMQREMVDAIRNTKKRMQKGFKEESIEFMKKQMIRDGLTEEQAERAATRIYRNSAFKDAARMATFGFLMQFLWTLGGNALYLLFGDDDKEKEEMLKDAMIKGAFGSIEGLGFGNIVTEAIAAAIKGDLKSYRPSFSPAGADLENLWNKFNSDWVAGANELVNIVTQMCVGVNPQTITDIALMMYDACDGDIETSKEVGIALLRLLQAPQSNIDKLKMDEIDFAKDLGLDWTIEKFARKHAEYKKLRNAGLFTLAYTDEAERKAEDKYIKRFLKDAEEKKRTSGNELAKAYYEFLDTDYKVIDATIKEYRKAIKEAEKSGYEDIANRKEDILQNYLESIRGQMYREANEAEKAKKKRDNGPQSEYWENEQEWLKKRREALINIYKLGWHPESKD